MSHKRIRRRTFIGIAGAAGLAAGVTACGGGGSNAEPDGPLKVALWGDATRAAMYRKAIALFTKAHQGDTANLQFADLDAYLERLATESAAGDLPDVLWMRDTHIGRYGKAKVLLDYGPYLDKTIHTADLGKQAIPNGKIGDGVYALPTHYVGQCVIGNKPALEDKGVKLADIKTWDDLAAAAKELGGSAGTSYGLSDPTMASSHRDLEGWVRQHGEELFTPGGGPGFTADTVIAYYRWFDQLRKAKVLAPADVQVQANGAGSAGDLLAVGKSALQIQSSNQLTQEQAVTKIPLVMTSLPAAADASKDWWFFPPILISASAKTKNPETAAKLIDFFLNDINAAKITRLNQGAPSSSKILDALLPTLDKSEKAFVTQIRREQKNPSRPLPIRPEGASQLDKLIGQASQQIAYGKASIPKAVEQLMAAAKKALPEQ